MIEGLGFGGKQAIMTLGLPRANVFDELHILRYFACSASGFLFLFLSGIRDTTVADKIE